MLSCDRTREFIHCQPLSESTSEQRRAVEEHCRECATCRAALTAATEIEACCMSLTEPIPPRDLVAAVLEQTSQAEDAADNDGQDRSARTRESIAMGMILIGMTLVVVAYGYRWFQGDFEVDVLSIRTLQDRGWLSTTSAQPAALGTALGLIACFIGLLALQRSPGKVERAP